jgi:hypothetical protein
MFGTLMSTAFAQSPNLLQYQAVVRNTSGQLVANQAVGMRVSLLKASATGTIVYSETHRDTTTANGLVTVDIGAGTVVSGSFGSINWGQGPYFIKTETDITGGTNYLLIGTTQLLSVPYSLYAQSASLKYSNAGDTLFSGKEYVIVPGLSSANVNAIVAGSPGVTTSVASSVTTVAASLGGNVISAGTSNVTSRGICYSTSASPTINGSTVASGAGIGSFTVNIPGLNPATTYYARAYATNATGTSYGNQVIFTTMGAVGQACAQGSTLTVTHTAGDVAPVTKSITYQLVQSNLSGESKCWIAQNLGADRQALSLTDNSEASAGWYWQFNRKQGYKHDGLDRTPNGSWSIISENSHWTSANDPCTLLLGSGWRLPLLTEWEIAAAAAYKQTNGNSFNSDLRIHYSGHLDVANGQVSGRGIFVLFALKNQANNDENYKGTDGGINNWNYTSKRVATSVRCLKD